MRRCYCFVFTGPSYTLFSSFSSGMDVLLLAKSMIEKGHVKAAIIGGCVLTQRPNLSLQLKGLGLLNDGLATKSFSDDGTYTLYYCNILWEPVNAWSGTADIQNTMEHFPVVLYVRITGYELLRL